MLLQNWVLRLLLKLVESLACSYLLKPVKPLETLNEAVRMTISHKRDVSCLEGLT